MLKYVKYVVHFWWRFQQNWLLASKATQSNSFLVCLFLNHAQYVPVLVTQSCPALCNLPDSFVFGILQARKLEWVAIPFSKGSSQCRDLPHFRQILYHLSHQGSPQLSQWGFPGWESCGATHHVINLFAFFFCQQAIWHHVDNAKVYTTPKHLT